MYPCVGQQVMKASPESEFVIDTIGESKKTLLRSVFVCPAESLRLFLLSQRLLALDCSQLKSEFGGVLFHASTMDGGQKVIPLGYMLAEEESPENWRLFISRLHDCGIPTDTDPECQLILQLCKTIETMFPELEAIVPDLAVRLSPWYLNGSVRRKKSLSKTDFVSLQSRFYRVVFCATVQVKTLLSQLMAEASDLVKELNKTGLWYRHAMKRQHVYQIESCIQQIDMVYLDHEMLRYVMLDDVVSGLYVMIARYAKKRQEEYDGYNSDSLTPFYQQLVNQYLEVLSSFSVTCIRDSLFRVTEGEKDSSEQEEVDLQQKTCTCGMWQEYQFPCIHCWCVIQHENFSLNSVSGEFFSCGTALQLSPNYALPFFTHNIDQQVRYYIRSQQSDDLMMIEPPLTWTPISMDNDQPIPILFVC